MGVRALLSGHKNLTASLIAISAMLTWSNSFMYRENRVPYYQRLFQNHDGKRQWWKVSRFLITSPDQ